MNQETLQYRCNICSSPCVAEVASLKRETPSCDTCRSSPRIRAVIRILSTELFGRSMPIAEFPKSPEIMGLGMSDWGIYATRLKEIFSYTNTFFAKAPRLDITSITPDMEGKYDFVIVSEVLEHVAPPVSRAFVNLRRMLKPGGFVVCTVPCDHRPGVRTKEHFPKLHDYRIEDRNGVAVLINTTEAGEREEFDRLIFHGPGRALEMRVFSEEDLIAGFRGAGFSEVRVIREPDLAHGVYWKEPFSLPFIART